MAEQEWLARQFEENRSHLRAVAYRMLGSVSEADDAVQESWLRLSGADALRIENMGGWLTTVVARICLDMLRSRTSRREEPIDASLPASIAGSDDGVDPEQEALLADSVGLAMLVVLDTLTPAERLAFVLHDLFGMPFDEIAPIAGRSPEATRQLASRARRRVRGADQDASVDGARHQEVVSAFLAASREGDFSTLLSLLDPSAVLRADAAAVRMGATAAVHGASAVAETFTGRARFAQPALIAGTPGAVWAPGGVPRVVFAFTFDDERITAIDLLADPDRLGKLDLAMLEDPS